MEDAFVCVYCILLGLWLGMADWTRITASTDHITSGRTAAAGRGGRWSQLLFTTAQDRCIRRVLTPDVTKTPLTINPKCQRLGSLWPLPPETKLRARHLALNQTGSLYCSLPYCRPDHCWSAINWIDRKVFVWSPNYSGFTGCHGFGERYISKMFESVILSQQTIASTSLGWRTLGLVVKMASNFRLFQNLTQSFPKTYRPYLN